MNEVQWNECKLDRLIILRHEVGLSQADLAKKAGLSPAAVSLLEKGDREPSLSTALALSDALNISVYALIGRIEYLNDEFAARVEITKLQQKIDKIHNLIT